MKTCDFCGWQGDEREIGPCAWPDSTGRETVRDGCRDVSACMKRQDEAVKEWAQAMGVKS